MKKNKNNIKRNENKEEGEEGAAEKEMWVDKGCEIRDKNDKDKRRRPAVVLMRAGCLYVV